MILQLVETPEGLGNLEGKTESLGVGGRAKVMKIGRKGKERKQCMPLMCSVIWDNAISLRLGVLGFLGVP